MHDIYKNIKRMRTSNGWSQDELAHRMGYSEKSAISRIESGKINLPLSQVEEFAKVFNVSPAYLMGWTVDLVVDSDGKRAQIEKTNKIDLEAIDHLKAYSIRLLGSVAAGIPIEAQPDFDKEIDVPFKYSNRDEYFGLKIKGDSMEPKISNGDIVIVHLQECAESGDIIIAQVSQGDATCKRFMQYGDTVLLRSFNSAYEDIDVTGDSEFKIIGRVVESRHTF